MRVSGSILFLAHDCEVNFVDVTGAASKTKTKPTKVFYNGSPLLSGLFTDETTLIAGGYDKTPMAFKNNGKEWQFTKHLDDGFAKIKQAAAIEKGAL